MATSTGSDDSGDPAESEDRQVLRCADMNRLQEQEGNEPISQQSSEMFFIQGISEVMLDSQVLPSVVDMPDVKEAADLLEDTGQVVLSGPRGCGKTTVALALLNCSMNDGFTPYIISKLEKLDRVETEVANGRSALLLDGTLGTVRVDKQQYDLWKDKRAGLMNLVSQGCCRLIFTVHPHVLREVRELEGPACSPLSNRSVVWQVGKALDAKAKGQILDFHLQKLLLDPEEHVSLVELILKTDTSGLAFPWCCQFFVDHWPSCKDPAIFSAPEETHALLFKDMMTHATHDKFFAAVFALIMGKFDHFLHSPGHSQHELTRLGFKDLCDDDLAEYADVLRGSILTEDATQFASREMYNAAAVALGRSFRLPTMLKACDAEFLVQHVRTVPLSRHLQEEEAKLCITVGLAVCSSSSRPVQTTLKDLGSLLDKVCEEIMTGHLRKICQHPSLQCPKFLQAMENHCQKNSISVQQLVTATDLDLPLIYWSVFSRHQVLTHWCLKHMTQTEAGMKLLSLPVLLACGLTDLLMGNKNCRLHLMKGHLTSKTIPAKADSLALPLLGRSQCLTPEILQDHKTVAVTLSQQCRLNYLGDTSLPIPGNMAAIQLFEEKMMVRVKDRQLWYLLLRLVMDREADETDQEENTLLHLAVSAGEQDIIRLALESGASLLAKNSQGKTAYQIAQKRQGQQKQTDVHRRGSFFTAIQQGDVKTVKLLLCHSVSIHDRDRFGRTALEVACRAQQEDIANLLIQLGGSVGNRSVSLPLKIACRYGLASTGELLIKNGACVNTKSRFNFSPLHYASQCTSPEASAEITQLLLNAGADVSAVDEFGNTPLHCAVVTDTHTDTVKLLIQHGADTNVQNEYRHSPLFYAYKYNCPSMLSLLVDAGAKVNNLPYEPEYQNCLFPCDGTDMDSLLY